MGSLSLARFLNYLWFRLFKFFFLLELSAVFTLIYLGILWQNVKKHGYDYFQLDIYYLHHLNTFHFLVTLMTLVMILVYMWAIKDSIEDVFLLVFLAKIPLMLFHLWMLCVGLLIWFFWVILAFQFMGIYFNQVVPIPWRLLFHLLMDGFILFAMSQFLSSQIPVLIYAVLKVMSLTIGFEGDYQPYIYTVLNYVYYDKIWQYPFEVIQGILVILLIYALFLFKHKANRKV